MSALLEVRDLSMRFGDRRVLRGIDLAVRPGEIFGLLGPNGSGKSTTFRILLGLLRPSGGEIWLGGRRVAAGARALRRRLGVVFQSPSLDPNLSCRENLRLAGRLHRIPRRALADRIEELLEAAALRDRADEPVKVLSGGMRRRLELARSQIHRPDLLLLDEPTAGLDEASFQRTWRRLKADRAAHGLTVLISTHRPEEAALCDRLALIDEGRVVACDPPAVLLEAVSDDVIYLYGEAPDELAQVLRERFDVEPRPIEGGGGVRFEAERGHELIPRLVEAFPAGRLRAVNLLRPSLADVFLHLTGRDLGEDRDLGEPPT